MREGYEGSSSKEGENLAPKDSIIVYNSNSWLIRYSPSKNCFYFQTNSYHPGELELDIEDIESMFLFLLKNIKKVK